MRKLIETLLLRSEKGKEGENDSFKRKEGQRGIFFYQ